MSHVLLREYSVNDVGATAVIEASTLSKAAARLIRHGPSLSAQPPDANASLLSLIYSQLLYDNVITDVEAFHGTQASDTFRKYGVKLETMPKFDRITGLTETVITAMTDSRLSSAGDLKTTIPVVPDDYQQNEPFATFGQGMVADDAGYHIQASVMSAVERLKAPAGPILLSAMYVVRGILYASRAYSLRAETVCHQLTWPRHIVLQRSRPILTRVSVRPGTVRVI